MSFFEPMMIPTSGPVASKSPSICSICASTCGSGSSAVPVSGRLGSAMSLMKASSRLMCSGLASVAGKAGDRTGGYVVANLHSIEGDPTRRIVRAIARRGRVGSEPGDVQDATAGGDDLAVALGRPGVGHLGDRGGLGQPAD